MNCATPSTCAKIVFVDRLLAMCLIQTTLHMRLHKRLEDLNAALDSRTMRKLLAVEDPIPGLANSRLVYRIIYSST